jgi:hypothetical protein
MCAGAGECGLINPDRGSRRTQLGLLEQPGTVIAYGGHHGRPAHFEIAGYLGHRMPTTAHPVDAFFRARSVQDARGAIAGCVSVHVRCSHSG